MGALGVLGPDSVVSAAARGERTVREGGGEMSEGQGGQVQTEVLESDVVKSAFPLRLVRVTNLTRRSRLLRSTDPYHRDHPRFRQLTLALESAGYRCQVDWRLAGRRSWPLALASQAGGGSILKLC